MEYIEFEQRDLNQDTIFSYLRLKDLHIYMLPAFTLHNHQTTFNIKRLGSASKTLYVLL